MLDDKVPNHIAIIMDGNGRWASQHNLPRIEGHRRGADAVRNVVTAAAQEGVNYLTLYAFSSENWKRPDEEVTDLMGLLRLYLKNEIKKLHNENIQLRIIGNRSKLDSDIRSMIEDAEQLTKDNDGLTLVIALSYGARDEIVEAVKHVAECVKVGELPIESITEATIQRALDSHDIPDPDLLIRTSGEYRVSNFLLWQIAYTEMLFLELYWPDFTKQTLVDSIAEYQKRDRRYGLRK